MTPKDSLPPGAPSPIRSRLSWSRVALAALGALLVVFIVGPLLRLMFLATPASFGEALRDRELLASIALTLGTATAATLIGALLGVPLAYLLARRSFRGRRFIEAVVELPVVIPHPVAGIALLLFLGRNSTVGGVFAKFGIEFVSHIPGIVAAMLFVSVPILVSGAREAFRAVDPRLERVARTLGDPPAIVFRRVTLPLAGRGILAAAVLAWARAVSEFGAIVILTYNPQVASVLIYDRFTTLGLSAAVPAALLLLTVALGVFALVRVLQPAERR
ncbi:MAG: ABC transporter permease subunit [Gemmatimonadales bacterium]|nr:MAG: ABC transporter permease subunit [Gemmatimonadales bacterium]